MARSFPEMCQYALNKWGMIAQLDQMAEECAEYIAALNRWKRGRITREKLLEEIADVSVMVQEMKVYFDIEHFEEHKIRRLNARIDRQINKELEEAIE